MNKTSLWICPLCKGYLEEDNVGYGCLRGHRYDKARQGYVNLLLANKKNSKEPGDSADMITARSAFLESGHYNFLLNHLTSRLNELCDVIPGSQIVDLGCGEGFYLRGVYKSLSERVQCWGIDISKPAIKFSATQLPEAKFAVASCFDIPLRSNSVNIALSIFAPFETNEIDRILKADGRFIRVSPGPRHLLQLKEHLYLNAMEHSPPTTIPNADLLTETTIKENVTLGCQDIKNLIEMTPLKWRGNLKAKEALLQIKSLNLDFEFIVQELQFRGQLAKS